VTNSDLHTIRDIPHVIRRYRHIIYVAEKRRRLRKYSIRLLFKNQNFQPIIGARSFVSYICEIRPLTVEEENTLRGTEDLADLGIYGMMSMWILKRQRVRM